MGDALSVWARQRSVPPPKKPRRWLRRLLYLCGGTALAVGGLWYAVHHVPWLGPKLADGLRAVIGVEGVARLEELVYGVEDRVNQAVHRGEAPQAYWDVPESVPPPPSMHVGSCSIPPFRPADVGPVLTSFSAPGDGRWVGIADARHASEAPRMYKTLLHSDPNRSWAAVSIVAADLGQVDVHLAAGKYEPRPETKEARAYVRAAVIPTADRAALLAAFNGGFKAEHGHYGMRVDGVTLIKPRSLSCWVALERSGKLLIGDWGRLKAAEPETAWWRQAPACMVDRGELHPGLRDRENTYWGATLDGDTVIRRSAIGLSADGKTLYVGIGDHTTARALAVAMKHAGASSVAQLDVNWSYPKFVLYRPDAAASAGLRAEKLCDGFEIREDEYLGKPAERDFFYLTRKSDAAIEKAHCGH